LPTCKFIVERTADPHPDPTTTATSFCNSSADSSSSTGSRVAEEVTAAAIPKTVAVTGASVAPMDAKEAAVL